MVREVKPRYPVEAIDAKVQGSRQVEVTIAPDGSVTSARILRKAAEPESPLSKALDEAAIEAAKQWKFDRVPKGGSVQTVEFTFTLRDGPPRKKAPK